LPPDLFHDLGLEFVESGRRCRCARSCHAPRIEDVADAA
jgi:hypothetical protein